MTTQTTASIAALAARGTAGMAARSAVGIAGLGAATLAYALYEAHHPVLRHVSVPVLAHGQAPLRILHISDLHLTNRTQARAAWVRKLANLHPDVVVNTGDNLSFASGLDPLRWALEPLLDLPGAFVLGDHDYHSTLLRAPTRYLRHDPRTADDPGRQAPELPWREVRDLMAAAGWADLTNARGMLRVGNRTVELVGVDDPHAERDIYPSAPIADVAAGSCEPAGRPVVAAGGRPVVATGGRPLRLGLTHAPYRRVLAAMLADGVDLALAGHTHGGQLCLPGVGTLVTNCDLDRGRARGLSRYGQAVGDQAGGDLAVGDQAGGAPAAGDAADALRLGLPRTDEEMTRDRELFLHVSAGLGTSPYTPVRVACRPEATLLTLVPVQHRPSCSLPDGRG